MELKTERLTVRYLEPTDWEGMLELNRDFNATDMRMYDLPKSSDPDEVRETTARWAEKTAAGQDFFFAVLLDGKMIGSIVLHGLPGIWMECGFLFHSAYHRQGYARESLSAVLEWAAQGKHTVFAAGTAILNRPAARFLEAMGFRRIDAGDVILHKDEDGNGVPVTVGHYILHINPGAASGLED